MVKQDALGKMKVGKTKTIFRMEFPGKRVLRYYVYPESPYYKESVFFKETKYGRMVLVKLMPQDESTLILEMARQLAEK